MNKFGKTVRHLRISRHLTQQTLAADLFDRSELSKLERSSTSSTSYENEIQLITRLGLTPNEFEYINNNYHLSEKRKLMRRFFDLKTASNNAQINSLLDDCLQVQNDEVINRISIVLRALSLLNQPDGLIKAKKMVQPIWIGYLSKIKILTLADIHILNAILFAFDYQTADKIVNKIIKVIDTNYPFEKSLKASVLINQGVIQMQACKFDLAANNLSALRPMLKELDLYDKLIVVNARIAVCKNNRNKALEQVDLLHKIGADILAESLESEIKDFISD